MVLLPSPVRERKKRDTWRQVHGTALRHVPDAYRRYLERFFAEAFQLRGTPLRIQFKAGANPYAESPGRRR